MGDFIIRLTTGSGVRRQWSYLSATGWVAARSKAEHFIKRAEAYAFAREQLGDFWHDNSVNAVRDNR